VDLSNPATNANLEAAFGGESMANRKYLFFAEVAKQLGNGDLARLFRDTANQETEHAFAHFRLLHPELVVSDPAALSEEEKGTILARCLELAIEGETYEYTTMYPEFAAQARADRDGAAAAEFDGQAAESRDHAAIFRRAGGRQMDLQGVLDDLRPGDGRSGVGHRRRHPLRGDPRQLAVPDLRHPQGQLHPLPGARTAGGLKLTASGGDRAVPPSPSG
jgi:rubrerythrin